MKNYKAIIFDYKGVIEGISGSLWKQDLIKLLGVTESEFKSAYDKHKDRVNLNNETFSERMSHIVKDLNKEDKLQEVLEFISTPEKINGNVIDLIHNLKNKGYKIGLLSNNPKSEADRIREDGIAELFDVFNFSGETGLIKPDEDAFIDILNKLGVSAQEVVYIDDSRGHISVATKLGFSSILFRSYDELILELEKLGLV